MKRDRWEANGNGVHKRISPHYATCIAVCNGDDRHKNAKRIAALPLMLDEIENAIDVLDPAMGQREIVLLRERLIRFQSSIEGEGDHDS